MNPHSTPEPIDPRHAFLTTEEVIARFTWRRTRGYQMTKSTGFPRPIGARYRLDTLMDWEDRVIAGELPGTPDSPRTPITDPTHSSPATPSPARAATIDTLAPAPVRRRTRGIRSAA